MPHAALSRAYFLPVELVLAGLNTIGGYSKLMKGPLKKERRLVFVEDVLVVASDVSFQRREQAGASRVETYYILN